MEPRAFSSQDSSPSTAREPDWVSLIRRVAGGDQSAIAALYDGSSRLTYGLLLRILGDAATAEEVLLDVYTQVWRQAANYDPERGSPLAWMMTIARSRALDRLRAGYQDRQRQEPLEVASEAVSSDAGPEEAASIAERRRLVRQALAELTPEQREAIELAYYSGLSHSEIALQLNQPLGTIKTRIRIGMLKLRDQLRTLLST